jgi:hypothetical protein
MNYYLLHISFQLALDRGKLDEIELHQYVVHNDQIDLMLVDID